MYVSVPRPALAEQVQVHSVAAMTVNARPQDLLVAPGLYPLWSIALVDVRQGWAR